MKIVVAARCFNNEKHVERFLHGYSFADVIVVSDGGSEDNSINLLKQNPKVQLHYFDQLEEVNGVKFNLDAPHLNYVIGKAKELEPDWLLLDDIDDVPNYVLREKARDILEKSAEPQINAYRLYMWGKEGKKYFPKMNHDFHPDYSSLWGWKPKEMDIHADGALKVDEKDHVSLVGLSKRFTKITPPACLLHFSWDEESVKEKEIRYSAMGIAFHHPFNMKNAGTPVEIPDWAVV